MNAMPEEAVVLQALFAAVDISDQPWEEAFSRLGLLRVSWWSRRPQRIECPEAGRVYARAARVQGVDGADSFCRLTQHKVCIPVHFGGHAHSELPAHSVRAFGHGIG